MDKFNNIWASPEFIESNNMKIIDIRTEFEWNQTGIVEGSHTITFFKENGSYNAEEFTKELDRYVSKDEKFLLICRTGSRTGQVSSFINQHFGYNSISLNGGIMKLIGEGYRTTPYNHFNKN